MHIRGSLAALLIGSIGLLTACGGSGSDESSSADPGTIVIGTIGLEGPLPDIAAAWVDDINEAGGINGHQVELIVKKVGTNEGLAAARELVEKDHVQAIVAYTDSGVTTWGDYVAAKNVPVIGGLPVDIIATTNPNFFPIGANIFANAYGLMDQAATVGDKFGELHCAELAQCAGSAQLFEVMGGALGVELTVSSKITTVGAADYTAACQSLIDGDVDSYTIGADGPVVLKIAAQCADLGLKATLIPLGITVRDTFLGEPAVDGALVADSDAPFFDTSLQGVKDYNELIKQVPDLGDQNGPVAFQVYIGMELFKKAVEESGIAAEDDVTSADLKDGLYQLKDETLGGLTPPLTFTQGRPTLINCYFKWGIEGGQFVDPDGLETSCAPADLVDTVAQAAGS